MSGDMRRMGRKVPCWVRSYVGLPYIPRGRTLDGVDCWGLFRLVQRDQYGIEVPSFADDVAYTRREDAHAVIKFLKEHKGGLGWHPIPIDNALEGDGILFRLFGGPMHVGTIVARNTVLHIDEGTASVAEPFNETLWKHRIVEEPIIGKVVYRHELRF